MSLTRVPQNLISAAIPSAKTANYTITKSDQYVLLDTASVGTFTATLPAASSYKGRLTLVKADAGFVAATIARAGSDTFLGGATSKKMNTQGEIMVLESDGVSVWYILQRYVPEVWAAFPSVAVGTFLDGVTSNPTYGTGVTNLARFCRRNSVFAFRWDYKQTGAGAAGSGGYRIILPYSLTADSGIITADSGGTTARVGQVHAYNANIGHAFLYNSTKIGMWCDTTIGSGGQLAGSAFSGLDNTTQYYSVYAEVPITDWGL